jgi:hypothetical protein
LRKSICFAAVFALVLSASTLFAQSADVAFGIGTVKGASTSNVGSNYSPQSVGGGVFPSFSGDFLIMKHFGVSGEVAWRATQNNYFGFQPFRPLFYDFNAIYVPTLGKAAAAELQAGIGAESIRFYTGSIQCSYLTYSCTNYVSSNHFMGHFGAGLRLYPFGNFFIRPEAHIYLVRNNVEFSGAFAERFGVSIGYSFGAR